MIAPAAYTDSAAATTTMINSRRRAGASFGIGDASMATAGYRRDVRRGVHRITKVGAYTPRRGSRRPSARTAFELVEDLHRRGDRRRTQLRVQSQPAEGVRSEPAAERRQPGRHEHADRRSQ